MAKHYLDFVGLNTFIYEPVGYDPSQQVTSDNTFEHEDYNYNNFVAQANVQQNLIGTPLVPDSLFRKRNYVFTSQNANLPTTASFFPALMLKRNGPYGFPIWKQIRISENPLSRKQRKENVFTFVTEPGPEVIINNSGRLNTFKGRYGRIQRFLENPVYSHGKPIVVGAGTFDETGSLQRFEVVGSYNNETIFFNNEKVNKYYNARMLKSSQYSTISSFYLNGGLDSELSPIDSFEYLRYRECVYPPRVYAYKNYTRQRTTFSFPWRDEREDRTYENSSPDFFFSSSYGNILTQSVWPLDAYTEFDTKSSPVPSFHFWYNMGSSRTYHQDMWGSGILQNRYTFGAYNLDSSLDFGAIDIVVGVGPLYNRFHTLYNSSSVVSPNGMNIEGINTGTTAGDLGASNTPSGEAKWEAGSQSGLNPFYDSYDEYIQGVRQYGKDYSIIPEFRISDHVETYQSKGLTEEISNLFSLTGALVDTENSSKTDFYKIYSNSEFMKHFEVIKKDHNEFVPPNSITMKCKAIKKLLPYEGFYPAQRSVDLAKQFYDSYGEYVSLSSSTGKFSSASAGPSLFQNFMVPMYAPGVFFNTIKSGVAVDYPLIDSNITLANDYIEEDGGNYYIKSPIGGIAAGTEFFDRRVPFESILEPEKYLSGKRTYCNEPHPYANNSGSAFWTGNGDNLYKLMAHNFIAEASNFFLKNKSYTTIASKPSSDPNIGLAEANTRYAMRVKMYKSTDSANIPKVSGSGGFYSTPQYPSSSRETFTMYSRPSAFGPPQLVEITSPLGYAGTSNFGEQGENYAFTPPYYYGEAWADITFVSSEERKYSFEEIIASSSVFYSRYIDDTDLDGFRKTEAVQGIQGGWPDAVTQPDKKLGMRLDASVNLFAQTPERTTAFDSDGNRPGYWSIQTKFETPMLNFNHLSATSSVTLPNNASQSVPRGMWHQYGLIEEDPAKGIFLQVENIPEDYVTNYLGETTDYKSLADLCGFSTEAVKLGQIADEKEIFEAVVAVPFIEQEGERKFFRLSREDVRRFKSGNESQNLLIGESLKKMLSTMRKYVFPPSMDFLTNPTIDPFAMYIFEFSHTLKKQDLANIWQNLYPEIGQTFETAESTISHELLAHELLGGGAILTPEGTLDVNAIGNEIPDRVQWMVFKVKQRAEINYYKKIIGRQDTNLTEATITSEGVVSQVSYNWPYDFFSLVELAKIEAEVKFAERLVKPGQEPRETIVPQVRQQQPTPIGNITERVRESANVRNISQLGTFGIAAAARQQTGGESLMEGLARAQAERERIGAMGGSEINEFGRTPAEAEERARLKAEGKLGPGMFKYRLHGELQSVQEARAPNTDYDGDGIRDPEDGGEGP